MVADLLCLCRLCHPCRFVICDLCSKFLPFVRRRQILGTFAMSEPQGLVALPLDPGSYLANTSSLTLALV